MTYKEFKKSNIDLSPVGFQAGAGVRYFCTPRGARILGSAGVDGIHYCFIRGHGETVFTVSPMNEPGNYVHPIALSWDDLLRLLLATGDMAALEQAHGWSRERFHRFLAEYPPTPEQQAVLDTIQEQTGLELLKDPYEYIHEIQAHFDYSALRFSSEYYDLVPDAPRPAWAVTFHGGFWGSDGKAGKEIPIEKSFQWGGYIWHVPAVYACSEGLVADFCVEVEPAQIKSFLDKWYPILGNDPHISRDLREQVEAENPMTLPNSRACLTVNGKQLREDGSSGIQWIPESCLPEDMEDTPEDGDMVAHYGLDPEMGWIFHRSRFRWDFPADISSLELEIKALPQHIPGPRFPTPKAGDEIRFTHPISGTDHILTVTEVERAQMDMEHFNDNWEMPTHYTQFTYTLSPELSNRQLTIRDTVQSDEPRLIPGPSPKFPDAACIGIIGGSDGPTAVIFTRKDKPTVHSACSSLHFEPVEDVMWQMVFHEKLLEDIQMALK